MDHKDTPLQDIPKDDYPSLRDTVNELIHSICTTAHQKSVSTGIQLEISPAELLSLFICHALKFNLSKQPDSIHECCQSILDHVSEFINSVVVDRRQAMNSEKKKTADDTETTVSSTEEEIMPTPPTSPTAERNNNALSSQTGKKNEEDKDAVK